MVHFKTAAALAVSALVGLSTSAQATTTSWGVHDPLETALVLFTGSGAQTIADEYTFSLASGSVYDIGSSIIERDVFLFL